MYVVLRLISEVHVSAESHAVSNHNATPWQQNSRACLIYYGSTPPFMRLREISYAGREDEENFDRRIDGEDRKGKSDLILQTEEDREDQGMQEQRRKDIGVIHWSWWMKRGKKSKLIPVLALFAIWAGY